MAVNPKSSNPVYVIRCECGEEIVVVPDLKLMKETIDNHLMQHYAKAPASTKERERLRKDLVESVVQRIIFPKP
jgi:hypothetical protein